MRFLKPKMLKEGIKCGEQKNDLFCFSQLKRPLCFKGSNKNEGRK
jgi:hypothetical protein